MKTNELTVMIDLLKSLVFDLEKIREGAGPSDDELASAPTIENWVIGELDASCLYGTITDHPLLGEYVRNARTSELWLINLDQQYARTLSRFYRLGKPRKLERYN